MGREEGSSLGPKGPPDTKLSVPAPKGWQIKTSIKLGPVPNCPLIGPRTSKMIFWTVKNTNTQIQVHKYTNTQIQHLRKGQKYPIYVKVSDQSNVLSRKSDRWK